MEKYSVQSALTPRGTFMPGSVGLVREGSPVMLLEDLVRQALAMRASDIHLEPVENRLLLRCRVDGLLQTCCELSAEVGSGLVSRLKVLAHMDITEKRIPQDGRCSVQLEQRRVDMRISTLPTIKGEKLVLRLLSQGAQALELESLDLGKSNMRLLRGLLDQSHGMVLITGPTGSGKTTTLYSMLQELNCSEKNILTIEDPVECQLAGINQVAVNEQSGLSFATGLRSLLRQDPDIIMIGEIRDRETAAIAVQAALTGHLVLSTLHTNQAAGVFSRLQDMGIEPYLLNAALNGAVAQRLVRRLCPKCKALQLATGAELEYLQIHQEMELYKPVGCSYCHGTGFYGRLAVQEILLFTDAVCRALRQGRTKGLSRLYADGKAKVLAGMTTVQELWREGILGGSYE